MWFCGHCRRLVARETDGGVDCCGAEDRAIATKLGIFPSMNDCGGGFELILGGFSPFVRWWSCCFELYMAVGSVKEGVMMTVVDVVLRSAHNSIPGKRY